MRILKNKNVTNIINADAKSVKLIAESEDEFTYEVSTNLDVQTALKRNVTVLDVSIHKDDPKNKSITVVGKKSADPDEVLSLMSNNAAVVKDAARKTGSSVISSKKNDLSKSIDNSRIGAVKSGEKITVKTVQTVSKSKLLEENTPSPIIRINKSIDTTSSKLSTRESALSLLVAGIDPASIPDKNSISTMKSLISGVHNKTKSETSVHQKSLFNSLSQETNHKTVDTLNHAEKVPVFVTSDKNASVKTVITVKKSDILSKSDLFVKVSANDDKGSPSQSFSFKVAHGDLVNELRTPKIRPKVAVSTTSSGHNVVSVEQSDLNAKKIRVYKKVLDADGSSEESTKYKMLSEIQLGKGDGKVKIHDPDISSSSTIYRAVSVGRNNEVGDVFTGVIGQRSRIVQNDSTQTSLKYSKIFTSCVNDTVNIQVRRIPPGTVAVVLLRRDLTFKEDVLVLGGDTPVISVGIDTDDVLFVDSNVKNNHVYEYKCKMISKAGSETLSAHSGIQKFSQDLNSSVNINISDVKVKATDDGESDVAFSVNLNSQSTSFSSAYDAIVSSGILDLFDSTIKLDADKIKDILATGVTRTNLTTGEKEDLGTVTGTVIKDSDLRKKMGAKKLKAGTSYRYTLQVQIRSPDTMLEKAKRSKVSSTGVKYKFSPSKHRDPRTLEDGMIRVKKFNEHTDNPFEHGATSIYSSVDVIIPEKKTHVTNVSVDKTRAQKNRVVWTVSGDIDKIDHFIITVESQGSQYPISSIHNQSSNGRFSYIDHESSLEGNVKYGVTPVYSDFTYGTPIYTPTIVN